MLHCISIRKIYAFGLLVLLFNCKSQYPDLDEGIYAEISTSKGNMIAKLFYQKAPVTTANFITLAEGSNTLVADSLKGKKFYDGLIFHRVINRFMIQGGDPLGTGRGNPGYRFNDEFHPSLKHNKPGILAMANSGPNSNGSQFYITEVARPDLDAGYVVFGELVSGLNIQDSISNTKTDANDKPLDSVVIKQLKIIRKGSDAKKFNAVKVFEDHFALEKQRIIEENKRKTQILSETKAKHNQQKAKAVTLPSGLSYFITEKGDGETIKETSQVLTHYALFFEDGKLLDTSNLNLAIALNAVNKRKKAANRYLPITADLNPDAPMIPGFKEGLKQLRIGDKATIFIPYHLGYGETGNRSIPPKANLIFEVELLSLAN